MVKKKETKQNNNCITSKSGSSLMSTAGDNIGKISLSASPSHQPSNHHRHRSKSSPRPSLLPPPDIVLLVEDQDSHEIRNVTLVCGEDCKNAISIRHSDNMRRGSNISVNSVVSVKGKGFGEDPRETRCWKCNKYVYTKTKKALTPGGFAASVFVCILCPLFAICAIPAIMKSKHVVIHKCPFCKIRLGSSSS